MHTKKLKNQNFILRTAILADVEQMAVLQKICFPTLSQDELLTKEHYANHIRIFPEGQLVIENQGEIIASSGTFRIHFPKIQHTFMELTDNLWITNAHMNDGEWLYQFDIGILPEYRGLGLSGEIYQTQQELVKDWGMQGQILVGMTIGYANYKDQFTIQEYCEKLRNQELTDPTVTPQQKAGFQWIKPLFNYLEDLTAGNCGIFMVWPLDEVDLKEYINTLNL